MLSVRIVPFVCKRERPSFLLVVRPHIYITTNPTMCDPFLNPFPDAIASYSPPNVTPKNRPRRTSCEGNAPSDKHMSLSSRRRSAASQQQGIKWRSRVVQSIKRRASSLEARRKQVAQSQRATMINPGRLRRARRDCPTFLICLMCKKRTGGKNV